MCGNKNDMGMISDIYFYHGFLEKFKNIIKFSKSLYYQLLPFIFSLSIIKYLESCYM